MPGDISLSVGYEVFQYAPNYPRVHWHPPRTGAIGFSDVPVMGIRWKVCILVENHSPLEPAGWRGGIKDKTHVMLWIHPPGQGQCWVDLTDEGLLDLCWICDTSITVIYAPIHTIALLIGIGAVLCIWSWAVYTAPQSGMVCLGFKSQWATPSSGLSNWLLADPSPGLSCGFLGWCRCRGGNPLTSPQGHQW